MEYLTQTKPAIKRAIYWFVESKWAGLEKSPIFEIVIIHLKVGAQKNIVKGPAGCAQNFLKPIGRNPKPKTYF